MNTNNKSSDLEQAYSPSTAARCYERTVQLYASQSEQALHRYPNRQIAYGLTDEEYVLLFEPGHGAPKAVLVFIHGGYWQALSAFDACFMAGPFLQHDWAYAAVNYTLAPRASIAEMITQCAAAILAIHQQHPGLPIVVAGSSAGAHLCAMMMHVDWKGLGTPSCPIHAGLLISGIYDLRPLVETYINEPLHLDVRSATGLSPGLQRATTPFPVTVCYGEHETEAFKLQSETYSNYLLEQGVSIGCYQINDVDHFDILFEFDKPDSQLLSVTLASLKLK
ncbi:alpha/beta hydrolase [Pseudomonas sp. GZD-222]|uniref:alpha/beta hydrolase n=1 Tax=Pseudomonas sp. GZD-222 TaxID=3404805 RepID=UPI003BB7C4EF